MPTPESGVDVGDIPSWLALAISLGTAAWQGVTERRNSKKEASALKLARLASLETSLAEVRSLAMSYWLHPDTVSGKDGLMLVHHIKVLSRDTAKYREMLWPEAQRDVLALKMQTTGSSFQQTDRPIYPASHDFVRKFMATATLIAEKIKDMRDAIEET